jgi:hypothetical protein
MAAVISVPVVADDPFPLRRVFVSTTQLAGRVAADGGGPYVRISRDAFEDHVRAAARALSDPPPHLVSAVYSATITDGQLSGTGTWTVGYPTKRPGPVPLDPLRVATGNATWSGGPPAVIYRPDAGPPVLWADPANGPTVRFDWSARAIEEPGERRYDLRLPVAAVATLELTLPAARTVSVPRSDALLTGPYPGPTAAERRWRLAFGGQSRLEFTVRIDTPSGRPAPVARANVDATYTLTTAQVDVTFAFDLETVRGPSDEWAFDVDPSLRVAQVSIPGGGTWDAASPTRLKVRPVDPEAAGRLTVRVVAPPGRLSLPTIRPTFGLPGEESVTVRLHPDLALDRIDPGDFRVTDAAVTPDGQYVLTFLGSLAGGPRRNRTLPTVQAHPAGPAFSTAETLVWSLRPGSSVLTVIVAVTPTRGPVDRVTVRLPSAYRPRPPSVVPDDPVGIWSPTDPMTNTWTWEAGRPWVTGKTVVLTVVAVGPVTEPGRPTPFPKFDVPAAGERVGSFRVEATGAGSVVSYPPVPTEGIPYRGEPPDGVLVVRPVAGVVAPHPANSKQVQTEPSLPTHVFTSREGVPFWYTSAEVRVESFGVTHTIAGYALPSRGRLFTPTISPPDQLVSLQVAGRWIDNPNWESDSVVIPIPADGDQAVPFEWTVRTPPPGGVGVVAGPYERNELHVRFSASPEYRFFKYLSRDRTAGSGTVVVRTSWVIASGISAGLLVLAFGIRYGSGRYGRASVFAALLALGGGLIALPAGWGLVLGPPFAAAGIAAVVTLYRSNGLRRTVVVAAVALAICPSFAQAPEPVTVFVTRDESGDLAVHAPQPLLDRLDSMAAGTLPAAVITAADYSARETAEGAVVTATFMVHVARSKNTPLVFPLTGVSLSTMRLDGQPAFPVARADGYAVAMPTPGRHVVTGTFTVAARPGPDREINFGVPDVPQSRLNFIGFPTSRQPTAPARRGSQSVTVDEAGPILAADLGGGKNVVVRWRSGPRGPRPGLSVRGAGVWDLSPADATLTTAFIVRSEQGGLTQLGIEVPSGLEPGRATVRTVGATGVLSGPTGVRDWTLAPEANGVRLLNLVFAGPVEGQAVVALSFFPTVVPTARPNLSFPRVTRTTDVESTYGLRYHGLIVTSVDRPGTVDQPTDTVFSGFKTVPELQLDTKPVSLAVQPAGPDPVVLRPTLRVGEPVTHSQSVEWTVGPRADAVGTVRWSAGSTPPAVVPFDIPADLAPTDFSGADVAAHTRSGTRAEAWLKKPMKTGSFTWRASRTEDQGGVDLPVPTPYGVGTFVVRPTAGWSISVPPAPGVTVRPAGAGGYAVTTGPGVRSVHVQIRPPDFGGK